MEDINLVLAAIATLIAAIAYQIRSGQKLENRVTSEYMEHVKGLQNEVKDLRREREILQTIAKLLHEASVNNARVATSLSAISLSLNEQTQTINFIRDRSANIKTIVEDTKENLNAQMAAITVKIQSLAYQGEKHEENASQRALQIVKAIEKLLIDARSPQAGEKKDDPTPEASAPTETNLKTQILPAVKPSGSVT